MNQRGVANVSLGPTADFFKYSATKMIANFAHRVIPYKDCIMRFVAPIFVIKRPYLGPLILNL